WGWGGGARIDNWVCRRAPLTDREQLPCGACQQNGCTSHEPAHAFPGHPRINRSRDRGGTQAQARAGAGVLPQPQRLLPRPRSFADLRRRLEDGRLRQELTTSSIHENSKGDLPWTKKVTLPLRDPDKPLFSSSAATARAIGSLATKEASAAASSSIAPKR